MDNENVNDDGQDLDLDFLRRSWDELEKYYASLDDDDFVLDGDQWNKLVATASFCERLAEEFGGHLDPIDLQPKHTSGCISLHLPRLEVKAEDIPELCVLLLESVVLTVDSMLDGSLLIELVIPGVFKHR